MNLIVTDKKVYVEMNGKKVEIATRESYDKLHSKEIYGKLIELGIRYLETVSLEIGKMDLKESEKFLAEIMVIDKVNEGIIYSFEQMFKESDKVTVECFSKVVSKMEETVDYYTENVRKDIPPENKIRFRKGDIESLKREGAEKLLGLCKMGKGKEIAEFTERVMKISTEEINRLGRYLTREEVFEICEDVRLNRR